MHSGESLSHQYPFKWAWDICTNPRRQPPASSGLCTLQWSHMSAQPACSKLLPAGSCRSPAPLLFAWPEPSNLDHTHLTCKGSALQTWGDIKRMNGCQKKSIRHRCYQFRRPPLVLVLYLSSLCPHSGFCPAKPGMLMWSLMSMMSPTS